MKKIMLFSVLFVSIFAALFSLTGCKSKNDAAGVQYVYDYIKEIYKEDYLNTETTITSGFERPTSMIYEDVTYQISWTLEVTSGNSSYVTLSDNEDSSMKVVSVDAFATETTQFKLTATIMGSVKKNYMSLEFKYVLLSDIMTYEEWLASEEGSAVKIKGVLTAKETYSTEYGNTSFYLKDESAVGGYMIYRIACTQEQYDNDFVIGNTIVVSAEKDIYNGMHETADGTSSYKVLSTGATVTADNITSVISGATDAAGVTAAMIPYQGRSVTFTGIITAVTTSSSKTYLTVQVGTNTIRYVLSSYFMSTTGEAFTELANKAIIGIEATFTGVMAWSSSNAPYPTAIDADGISLSTEPNLLKRALFASEVIEVFDNYYIDTTEITLPATKTAYSGVTFTYSVVTVDANGDPDTTSAVYNSETGVLTINPGAANAFVTITLSSDYVDSVDSTSKTYSRTVSFTIIGTAEASTPVTGVTSLADDDIIIVEGWVTGTPNATYGNLYIQDIEGNSIQVYGLYNRAGDRYDEWLEADKIAAGDYIKVIGPKDTFSLSAQIKDAALLSSDDTKIVKTVSDALALTDSTEQAYYITGKVGTITDTTNGVFTLIDTTNESNTILVNGLTDATKAAGTFSQLSLKTNMVIIIVGYKTTVSEVVQITSAYAAFVPEVLDEYAAGFTVDFEPTQSFVAGQSYNNTVPKKSGNDKQWSVTMGCVSTTGAISGAQSMQMRYYGATTSGTYGIIGYAQTYYLIDGLKTVTFDAANTGNFNVAVSMSTDLGETWTNSETFTLTTSLASYSYVLVAATDDVMIRFTVVAPASPGTSTYRVYLDNVQFLPVE